MANEAQLRLLAIRLWLSSNCYDMTAAVELWQMRKEMIAETEAKSVVSPKPVPHH